MSLIRGRLAHSSWWFLIAIPTAARQSALRVTSRAIAKAVHLLDCVRAIIEVICGAELTMVSRSRGVDLNIVLAEFNDIAYPTPPSQLGTESLPIVV